SVPQENHTLRRRRRSLRPPVATGTHRVIPERAAVAEAPDAAGMDSQHARPFAPDPRRSGGVRRPLPLRALARAARAGSLDHAAARQASRARGEPDDPAGPHFRRRHGGEPLSRVSRAPSPEEAAAHPGANASQLAIRRSPPPARARGASLRGAQAYARERTPLPSRPAARAARRPDRPGAARR